jgi:asparagine synthase (glutamine-hydrolysing)
VRRVLSDGRVVVMGHARLALVCLADGRQPFVSDEVLTVVNGEFYDWRRRRCELERLGGRFDTSSDSEIAHAAFGLHGPDGWLEHLDGEWAACAIDLVEGSLHAACDPFGARPLRHWTSPSGRSIAVASEAKALFELGVPRSLDRHALRFSLSLQYLPLGSTLFADVGMLPAGCRLDHDGRSTRIRTWSDLALGMPRPRSPLRRGVGPVEIMDLLEDAVRRRIPEERDFATHLSGGLDSALVLALASRAAGRSVDAFTADFEFGSNEVEQAAVTATHCGARHVPVHMTTGQLVDATDRAAFHAEGLCINAHAAAKIVIAQTVSAAGHRCVLTGEGADEAFWGYEHLRLDAGLSIHADAAANTAGVHRPDGDVEGLDDLAEALRGPVPTFIRTKMGMTTPMRAAFGDAMRHTPFRTADMADALPGEWLKAMHDDPGASTARAMWNLHGLSGYILRGLDDAMGMSHGVESRLAFLDPLLHRTAAALRPEGHFRRSGLEKALLRDAAQGLIPEEVRNRRKAPFMAPTLTSTPVGRRWSEERLLDGRLVSSGILTDDGVRGLLASPDTPARDANVMTLASLSSFIQAFDL